MECHVMLELKRLTTFLYIVVLKTLCSNNNAQLTHVEKHSKLLTSLSAEGWNGTKFRNHCLSPFFEKFCFANCYAGNLLEDG